MEPTFDTALGALRSGLPVLLGQFAATAALLACGVAIYMLVTPFHERRLAGEGNVAAGLSLGGAVTALSIPLAATLATSQALGDIVLWGIVALALQLLALGAAMLMVRDLKGQIQAGNVAAAAVLVGVQLGVALLNAAAMAG